MRTLVHDARLVAPMDDARTRLPGGWVLVEDDGIVAVGPPPVPWTIGAERRIDARGKVVLPGLVTSPAARPRPPTSTCSRAARSG